MEDKIGRLCYLIELVNAPLRVRNNAYLRNWRLLKKLRESAESTSYKLFTGWHQFFVEDTILGAADKIKKNNKIYDKARKEAAKISKKTRKERSQLTKELGVFFIKRMSMCPIMQYIRIENKNSGATIKANKDYTELNGKQMRKLAADHIAERILLGEYKG